MSRIAGWTAHRIEELNFDSKRIIRPAYRNVSGEKESFRSTSESSKAGSPDSGGG